MSDALSHAKRIVDSPWTFVSSAASPCNSGYAGAIYHAPQVAQALIDKEEEVKRLQADLRASESLIERLKMCDLSTPRPL